MQGIGVETPRWHLKRSMELRNGQREPAKSNEEKKLEEWTEVWKAREESVSNTEYHKEDTEDKDPNVSHHLTTGSTLGSLPGWIQARAGSMCSQVWKAQRNSLSAGQEHRNETTKEMVLPKVGAWQK